MPEITEKDHLSRAERLALYYVAPRVTGPFTLALLAAYSVVLLEAVVLCGYGLWRAEPPWREAGVAALAGAVGLGVAIFVGRAIIMEVRYRRALRAAAAGESQWDTDTLGDPFEGRVLLSRPCPVDGDIFGCGDEAGQVLYYVARNYRTGRWQVRDAQDAPALEIVELKGPPSFALFLQGQAEPRLLQIRREGQPVAEVRRRPGLYGATARVRPLRKEAPPLIVAGGGVYCGGRLVGRLYRLRKMMYLDVERAFLGDGLLGYFLSLR